MDVNRVLDGLLQLGQDTWIPLWVIVQDVADLLGIEDEKDIIETTAALARGLLQHGFRAGDAPDIFCLPHFHAWTNQSPDFVVEFIRCDWTRRASFPLWGDAPWFAHDLLIPPCSRSIN
jgi:hypothetical protein